MSQSELDFTSSTPEEAKEKGNSWSSRFPKWRGIKQGWNWSRIIRVRFGLLSSLIKLYRFQFNFQIPHIFCVQRPFSWRVSEECHFYLDSGVPFQQRRKRMLMRLTKASLQVWSLNRESPLQIGHFAGEHFTPWVVAAFSSSVSGKWLVSRMWVLVFKKLLTRNTVQWANQLYSLIATHTEGKNKWSISFHFSYRNFDKRLVKLYHEYLNMIHHKEELNSKVWPICSNTSLTKIIRRRLQSHQNQTLHL